MSHSLNLLLVVILAKPLANGRDHLIQQSNRGENLGLRQGDWKLHAYRGRGDGAQNARYELYDLAKDPAEKNNLAKQEPDQLQAMRAKLDLLQKAGRSRPQ